MREMGRETGTIRHRLLTALAFFVELQHKKIGNGQVAGTMAPPFEIGATTFITSRSPKTTHQPPARNTITFYCYIAIFINVVTASSHVGAHISMQ